MSQSNSWTIGGKILIYHPGNEMSQQLVEMLQQSASVRIETTADDARQAMEEEQFDFVVTHDPELMLAEPQLGTVLDSINQGVCLVNLEGRIVWCNDRVRHFPESISERIKNHCNEIFSNTKSWPTSHRPRFLSLVSEDERYFDAAITPLAQQRQNDTLLVAVISETTRARRLQQKMDAIDNAGRELVKIDADQMGQMSVPQRLELLEQKIIRLTRELLHFDNFAIRLLEKNTAKLELVLCAGLTPEAEQIDVYASTENSGISGYVAATGRSYICADVANDPRYLIGIDNANSSLTVPLRLQDHVIGVFNIESEKQNAFSEDDRQFAEIFARHIAIALHMLDVVVSERYAATGQVADNVSTEISGPLGDILADASTLMEDYIGNDDLRHRLQHIADNVVTIRESLKHVSQPSGGILDAKPTEPEIDPLLQGKKILVVDDEEIIRQTVRDVLVKNGCEVETARDGEEALAMIKQRNYDLVVTDIKMPGASGYDIFRAVSEQKPECPVMFMTGFGYDPNHSVVRATPEGLAAVLYKPFKVDELLNSIRAAISSS
jgi:CheY-like chemotaxis protein